MYNHTDSSVNKFFNLCVQGGKDSGYAVILRDGANNNDFMGTYLENPNYIAEVDFTTSKYNEFTGGRPIQYGNAFVNNNGTNFVRTLSIQYTDAIFERGRICRESVNVIAKETDSGLPSAMVTAYHNGDNKVKVDTLGTSVNTEIDFDKVIIREDNKQHICGTRKYKGFGMLTYNPTFDNFANGTTVTGFTSTIGESDMVIAQCKTPNVHVWCVKTESGQHKLTVVNNSGSDLSEVTLEIVIIHAISF